MDVVEDNFTVALALRRFRLGHDELARSTRLVPNFTEARVNVVDETPGLNESCFVDPLRAACVRVSVFRVLGSEEASRGLSLLTSQTLRHDERAYDPNGSSI